MTNIVYTSDFGAVFDKNVDDTAAVQDALDSGARKVIQDGYSRINGTLRLPDMPIIFDGLTTGSYGNERTSGFEQGNPTGTILRTFSVSDPNAYHHNTVVQNLRFQANWQTQSGIGFDCYRMGEQSYIGNLMFGGWSDEANTCGLKYTDGTPGRIGYVGFHNNPGIGMRIFATGGIVIELLSGDNNKHLLEIDNSESGSQMGVVTIQQVKAETHGDATLHDPLINIKNGKDFLLAIHSGRITGYGSGKLPGRSIIGIEDGNGSAQITLSDLMVRSDQYDNLIKDDVFNYVVPVKEKDGVWIPKVGFLTYRCDHRIVPVLPDSGRSPGEVIDFGNV